MKPLKSVSRAIVGLRRNLKLAVKELNAQAARKVAQGRYGASQEMVDIAKAVQEFATGVEELSERWNAIGKKRRGVPPPEATPLWAYYRLIAHALVGLGGEGTRNDIIEWVEDNAVNQLKPGDLAEGAKGEAVWSRMLARAKGPMAREGFIEPGGGKTWRLTLSGKNLCAAHHDAMKGQDAAPS